MIRGIDISNWQGEINFPRLAQTDVRLLYIKATEGTDYRDPRLDDYYDGARREGLKTAFYHYLLARTDEEARAEARYFAGALSGRRSDALFAVEPGNRRFFTSKESFSRVVGVFLEEAERLLGIGGMIYTDSYSARADYTGLTRFPLWVAQYGVAAPDTGEWSTWTGWQYTDKGRRLGIDGYVDEDYFRDSVEVTKLLPQNGGSDTRRRSSVVYYTVQSGDTLYAIARRFGVTVEELVKYNSIKDPERIYPGQVLRIYTDAPRKELGAQSRYIVQRGDTLYDIAQNSGTDLNEILRANSIQDPNRIYPGQVVSIPRAGGYNTSRGLDSAYIVRPGDNLTRIANRLDVSVQRLVGKNNIANPDRIYVGQVLKY